MEQFRSTKEQTFYLVSNVGYVLIEFESCSTDSYSFSFRANDIIPEDQIQYYHKYGKTIIIITHASNKKSK